MLNQINQTNGNMKWSGVNQQERLTQLETIINAKGGKEKFSFFLAGLLEGQSSLWASIINQPKTKLGIQINIGFTVTLHETGLPLLKAMQSYFEIGRLYLCKGSTDLWAFEICDKKSMTEKVIPFFEEYVIPYSCQFTAYDDQIATETTGGTFLNFKRLMKNFEEKKHLDKQGLKECVEVAFKLNPFSKGGKRKRTLEDVLEIIDQHSSV